MGVSVRIGSAGMTVYLLFANVCKRILTLVGKYESFAAAFSDHFILILLLRKTVKGFSLSYSMMVWGPRACFTKNSSLHISTKIFPSFLLYPKTVKNFHFIRQKF